MSKQRKHFNERSQKLLKDAIDRLPGLADSLKSQNIDLATTDEIHVFGYGSLPDQPHYPPTSKTTAYLWDYQRDMCCKSVVSGTNKKTGLTLGLDKKAGSIVPGAVLSYSKLTEKALVDMLTKLAEREVVTALEIYKFDFLEVEKADGSKVKAIICIADPDKKMGYAGDMLTSLEKDKLTSKTLKELSLRKKAHEIAWANGTARKSGNAATGKSYFDRFVLLPLKDKLIKTSPPASEKINSALYKEQQYMLKLADYIDEERNNMKKTVPEYVAILENRETEQLKNWKENKIKLKNHLKNGANKKANIGTKKPPSPPTPHRH